VRDRQDVRRDASSDDATSSQSAPTSSSRPVSSKIAERRGTTMTSRASMCAGNEGGRRPTRDRGPLRREASRDLRRARVPLHAHRPADSCLAEWSGSPGSLPSRGPHRSGRAGFPHPAPRDMASLRNADGARLQQRVTLQKPIHCRPGETALGAAMQPSPPHLRGPVQQRPESRPIAHAAVVAVVAS
jgi:hypothetical protein